MKIPKQIQIAGRNVKISYDKNLCQKERYNGACYYDKSEIIIDPDNPPDKIQCVFIHEIIHFVNAILRLDNTSFDKETYVRPLSELLYQVFKQIEGGK